MQETWSPKAYMQHLVAEAAKQREADHYTKRQHKAHEQTELIRKNQQLRERIITLLGLEAELSPDTQRKAREVDLAPVLLERVQLDGYTRERIAITTYEGLRMPMYVLIPDAAVTTPSRGFHTVVACHGHGYGNRDIVGLEADGTERKGNPGLHKDFAISLVKRGFLVAAPELIGFGDRRWEEDKSPDDTAKNSCFRLASHLLLLGRTLAGFRIHETMRVMDYLCGRPDVNTKRLSMMGISGGGLVASFTAALDDRVFAAVVSGYASTFASSILARPHCLDNYVPGVLLEAEMPDILGLIAPRPLFLENGTKDHLFPIQSAQYAYDYLQQIYGTLGAEANICADFFEGGHEINGSLSFDWLERVCKG